MIETVLSSGRRNATRRRSRVDRWITGLALGMYSMPTFLLGQLLLFFLFFQLYQRGLFFCLAP